MNNDDAIISAAMESVNEWRRVTGGSVTTGLTVRDHFAAQALQGLIADRQYRYGGDLQEPENYRDCAEVAYVFADAMMKARNENQ